MWRRSHAKKDAEVNENAPSCQWQSVVLTCLIKNKTNNKKKTQIPNKHTERNTSIQTSEAAQGFRTIVTASKNAHQQ